MKFYKQLNGHYLPNGLVGDCYRTCLACLLDKHPSEVPHFLQEFYDPETKEIRKDIAAFDKRVNDWLNRFDLAKVDLCYDGATPLSDLAQIISDLNGPDLLYMVHGAGSAKDNHVVIYRGAELLWNPSSSQLIGPCTDDKNWWFTFLISSRMRYNGPLAISE